ncbi:type IV secretory system conjugative DNA transfer family protein [Sphingomonas ginkgonis]|uniref:Type IV secretory system conjugative DNA transfer family protein n=2 Tax=Sphingomonas ginkgonis TaxID=2315330 RepID=A0A429V2C5_9SPHN|nr:type IV secretory system conjugative DNA transfer family protein [Sphingomonas ginkgonis]RST26396.1 type IV secretory system conjugative DNA transfer family protein [Sphingomonas ginkgonis]
MTRQGVMPPKRGTILALGIPVGIVVAFLITSVVAWIYLGLPSAKFDIFKMPAFFWYYRHDPVVLKALAGGALVGTIIAGLMLWWVAKQKPPLHGAARFAKEGEIRRAGFRAGDGIVLGKKGGKFLTFGGSEHCIVEAPTRSGKGVGIVIPNLLSWQESVVVLDVKRENWDATAGFRKKYGQAVYLFNPTDPEGQTARYNPLGYIDRTDPDQVVIELQKIATMLFVPPERGEPFWTDSARTAFVGVGAYLAVADQPFTIGSIYRLMTTGDTRGFFRRVLDDRSLDLSQGCRNALADFTSGADNTFASIVQTVTSKLSLWLNPRVDAATEASDFDLRELRSRRMSIYLGVSPDELDRVAPLYNLLFQQLVDLNVRDLPDTATPLKILVILDEFARIGRAQVIASAFSYVAGYGIRLLPVIQSRSQLRAVYGEHVANEIVANCGVEVAFTPKELRVANELSERIGYVGQESVTKSLTIHGVLANRSKSMSDQRRALLLPQELMQFPDSELLLLRGGIPPIHGEKIRYYADGLFRARVEPAPEVPPIPRTLRDDEDLPECAMPTFDQLTDPDPFTFAMDCVVTQDHPDMLIDVSAEQRGNEVVGVIEQER